MSEAPQAPALWQLLQHTASAVQAVMAGKSLTAQLEAVSAPLRPGTQALSFQVMRELGRAKALRALLAPKAPPPAANALLCSALALCWDDAHAPYPAHTLVNQAVEAARRNRHTQAQAGFINACLRRFLRERSSLVAQTAQDAQAVWNHPSWWITRLQQDHPASAQAWLLAAQQAAPMTLRVHQGRHTVAEYQDRLAAAGMPRGRAVGMQGLELAQAVPVQRLPGFAQGDVSVQDAAAQVAAQCLLQGLAQDHPWRVLDACAAPGGKTGHLLELCPQAQVLALEIDPVRAQRIHQNLERLSVQAQVLTADAADPDAWWDGQSFDAILLDAPCTASGIVRRHPDVRWLRREGDSAQLAQLQLRLLERLWPLLRPGGRLLYCTCSVFRTEGVEVVQAFLARNTRAILRPSPGHLIAGTAGQPPSVEHNPLGDHDSFYYALLEKSPEPL